MWLIGRRWKSSNGCSRAVLIGRGLDHNLASSVYYLLCSSQRARPQGLRTFTTLVARRRGTTRSHPEHDRETRQQREYCTREGVER